MAHFPQEARSALGQNVSLQQARRSFACGLHGEGRGSELGQFTFCVCTYNSATTLNDCLRSIRDLSVDSRLIIVDHDSRDETLSLASRYSTEVHKENRGLGFARQLCFDLVDSDLIVFVDSDVEIMRKDFLDVSNRMLADRKYGTVVGMPLGHKFAYGLPASLLVLRTNDFE